MPGTACHRIQVTGHVLGVGYRPFVARLASELGLSGWVRKTGSSIEIQACGAPPQVNALIERLFAEAPPGARVDSVRAHPARRHDKSGGAGQEDDAASGFVVLENDPVSARPGIGHDSVVCEDCLGEMFTPRGRRWRYAFTNCARCGPRYTISYGLPYDRSRTSLAPFAMCRDCAGEYARPGDRRFHAEANCCSRCGPQLALLDADGKPLPGDPLAQTLELLAADKIVAIKGPGGFQLICNARSANAVASLRQRRGGDAKPLALLVANLASASALVQIGIGEPALLEAIERPIVVMKKRQSSDSRLPGVAPELSTLGLMLPAAPLHYLLFHQAAGSPAGAAWLARPQELALAVCSANLAGEPQVIANDAALLTLDGIADAYLVHDCAIAVRSDDSIVRAAPGGFQFLRRGRGYTPQPIRLPYQGPATLAVGGRFKNTVCVTRGNEAFVSQHIGELDSAAASAFFAETVNHLLGVLQIKPERVAHDPDPHLAASRFALDYAAKRGLQTFAVPHQHAQLAALLAEHGIRESCVGLVLDDASEAALAAPDGGELLEVRRHGFTRLAGIASLALPGGNEAAAAPWRSAAAVLQRIGRGAEIETRFAGQPGADLLSELLAHCSGGQPGSGLGHWIDAAAGLLGICTHSTYRGQAGMLLESLAERHGEMLPLASAWTIKNGELDLTPLLAALADETNPGRGAAIFHATLAAALAEWLRGFADSGARILGAGGCFLNQALLRSLRRRLAAQGMKLIEAQRLPPNGGGLALGQAWVAMHREG